MDGFNFTPVDDRWQVSQFLNIPHHTYLSSSRLEELMIECERSCIQPVQTEFRSHPISGKVIKVKLFAEIDSKEEAHSTKIQQAFVQSKANVSEILLRLTSH